MLDFKPAADFLRGHDNFLILTHHAPDGDTLGSAAALCRALRQMGKTVWIAPNPELTPTYAPFVAGLFAPEDYRHDCVVSVDIASVELIPPEMKRWATERRGSGDVGADATPCHHPSHVPLPDRAVAGGCGLNEANESPSPTPVPTVTSGGAAQAYFVDLRIDHHPVGNNFAPLSLVDPTAAACGEVIYMLLETLGVTLDASIALPLYLALTTDTGCFRYSSTDADTHRIAAALIDTGIDRYAVDDLVFFQKSRAQIAIEGDVLRNIEYLADGQVALIKLSLDTIRAANAQEDDLDNISALPLAVEGVKIGLTLKQYPIDATVPKGIKISVRTTAPYEAGTICRVLSGGGGHLRAGGGRLVGVADLDEGRWRLLDAVRTIYPDLDVGL